MNIRKLERFCLACSMCLLVCFSSLAAQAADNFTNKDLLEFPKSERDAYITGAIITAAHAIYLYDKEKGQCFTDWFFENPNERVSEIDKAIKDNPDLTPSSIILSLPQMKCGRLKPKKVKPDEKKRETKP